jgi:hypothetical protein
VHPCPPSLRIAPDWRTRPCLRTPRRRGAALPVAARGRNRLGARGPPRGRRSRASDRGAHSLRHAPHPPRRTAPPPEPTIRRGPSGRRSRAGVGRGSAPRAIRAPGRGSHRAVSPSRARRGRPVTPPLVAPSPRPPAASLPRHHRPWRPSAPHGGRPAPTQPAPRQSRHDPGAAPSGTRAHLRSADQKLELRSSSIRGFQARRGRFSLSCRGRSPDRSRSSSSRFRSFQ